MKVAERNQILTQSFKHFSSNTWRFENKLMIEIQSILSPNERESFEMDTKNLNFYLYFQVFTYGMKYFMFKQETLDPNDVNKNIVNKAPKTLIQNAYWVQK